MFRVVVVILFAYLAASEPTGRIVGGNESSIIAHPYQVSIRHKNCPTCPFTHRCGAVIYSERILISSANCVSGVNPRNLNAVAGTNSIVATEGILIPILSYIIHQDYESFYIDYDISLIILALDLPFGDKHIAPIPLAKVVPEKGSTAYVTGWGSITEGGNFSEQLKVAQVRIVSDDDCKRSYGATRITKSMICAGVVAGQADSCKGDSGGPLVVRKELVGIVSWGRGCGRPEYPGVYTNVITLGNWVEDSVAQIQ